ncbi:MAG: hypothetical protein ACJ71Y_07195 [Blastococcus sp.]
MKVVTERWPDDATQGSLEGARRWLLAEDVDRLDVPAAEVTRLAERLAVFRGLSLTALDVAD